MTASRKMREADRRYNTKTTNVRVEWDVYDRLMEEAEYKDTMNTVIKRLLDYKQEAREVKQQ